MRTMKRVATFALVCSMMAASANTPASAAAKINVKKVAVESSITGDSKTVYVAKGKKVSLKSTVTVTPNKSANKGVTYKSSNKKVATVTKKGVVKGVKKGTAKITVTSKKNTKKSATIQVQVKAAAVSKVALNQTEAAIKAGEKLTLQATVTAGKKACKKVVWSSSDKKVVKVTKKGVVKAVAAGTATVTVKAIDGSGKKATCKVTVTDTNSIAAMDVLNAQTISFTLAKAQQLTADQISLKTKQIASGEYKKALKVDSVTSADGIHYTVIVNSDTAINLKDYVQLSVAGIEGVFEKQYIEEICAFAGDTVEAWTVGTYSERAFSFSEMYGYSEYAIANLPAGLTSEVKDNKLWVKGTPVTAGNYVAVLTAKDETGNTLTRNIIFTIGSDTVIAAAAAANYSLASTDTSIGVTGYAAGGSGQYKYEIVADTQNTGATVNKTGKQFLLSAKFEKAGDYTVKVKVSDANDANKFCETDVVFHIIQGVSISGMAKDAQGNAIKGATISFTNKNRADRYFTYGKAETDAKTGAYSITVSPGDYDVVAERKTESAAGCAKAYLDSQALKADNKEFHITMPLYRVELTSADSKVNERIAEAEWYWNNEVVGKGSEVYVKPGSYTFETERYTKSTDAVVKVEGDWFTGYKKQYTYPASINKLTCLANVDNIALQATVTETLIKDLTEVAAYEWLAGKDTTYVVEELGATYCMSNEAQTATGKRYAAYRFVPKEDGTYAISSSKLAFYDAEGKKMTANNGAYSLKKGATYYIADANGAVADSETELFKVTKAE